jgi:hypothetical protein
MSYYMVSYPALDTAHDHRQPLTTNTLQCHYVILLFKGTTPVLQHTTKTKKSTHMRIQIIALLWWRIGTIQGNRSIDAVYVEICPVSDYIQ